MSLESRISKLEQKAVAANFMPMVIVIENDETNEEAFARYELKNGVKVDPNNPGLLLVKLTSWGKTE